MTWPGSSVTQICHRCGGEKTSGKEYAKVVYYDHDQETCFQVLRNKVDELLVLSANLQLEVNGLQREMRAVRTHLRFRSSSSSSDTSENVS